MKDTFETYEMQRTDAVAEYEAREAEKRRIQERNGAAVMMMFLPFASAADPKSPLGIFTRYAPFIVTGIILAFASAVALGYV